MNCVIIDDDKFSTRIIEDFIGRTDGLHLVGSYTSAVEAINKMSRTDAERVNIIFLDIEMPEMSGIEFLKSLTEMPQVIIYSSQEKYALEMYEYDVTDYLLKPVNYARFIKSINRVKERFEKKETLSKESTEIFIKNNNSLVRVKFEDILWIEALENYVVVNTFKDKFTIHFTMKSIAEKMPADKFVRVHRSFIVNMSKVKSIEDNSVIIRSETGSKVIPIGKSYKDRLMNDINLISK
ncbi:MAG: LytR/AlgR family response regulator transcription factor [Breznakibacter sp.]